MRSFSRRKISRCGFTLIELLVVIGIIVLLVSLGFPMLAKALRQGKQVRVKGDFQTISTGLEAYKQDFGDYPPVQRFDPANPATASPDLGAATLCKALLGPFGDGYQPSSNTADTNDPPAYDGSKTYLAGQCVTNFVALRNMTSVIGTGSASFWGKTFNPCDGADGPGFKIRRNPLFSSTNTTFAYGRTYGPYVQQGKLAVSANGCAFLDYFGNPILYFQTSTAKLDLTANNAYVARSALSYIDANDNLEVFRQDVTLDTDPIPLNRIQIMLGDSNANGVIDAANSETPVSAGFVLYSAGADGVFGPNSYTPSTTDTAANIKAVKACDDITTLP